jgi:methyl-accepting chemotaxis protein
MHKMKMGTKIASGFGLLILLSILLGGLAIWNMDQVATESTKLATEYVPEVDVATKIRGAANRVMYAMRGYGLTENQKYYEDAQKELKALDQALAEGDNLAANAVYLTKLSGALGGIKKALASYRSAVDSTKKSVARMEQFRRQLDKNAAVYMQASNDFLTGQNQAFDKDLAERQLKINLVSQLVNLGTTVRVLNFKAQALNDPGMLADAMSELGKLGPVASKLRGVTRQKEDLELIGRIEAAAEGYLAAMAKFMRQFKLGDAADQTVLNGARKDMDKNAGVYVKNCAEFLAGQQEKLTTDMNERKAKITLANNVIDLGNDTRIKAFKSQALREPGLMKEAQKNFPQIKEKFGGLRKITRLDEDLAKIGQVEKAAAGYSKAMEAFLAEWTAMQNLGQQRDNLGKDMISACVVLADAGIGHTVEIANNAMHELNNSSYILMAGLAVALVMALFLTRSITKPINRGHHRPDRRAPEQVAAASTQVVRTPARPWPKGASQQAASLGGNLLLHWRRWLP